MNAWPFLVFSVFTGIWLYLHFFLAHREYRRMRAEEPVEIAVDYVRMEDYMAQSFRAKVREWLELPSTGTDGGRARWIDRPGERIRVSARAEYTPGSVSDEVLVVEEDLVCGNGCTFGREILVRRNARIGRATRLQSIAADGTLTLQPETTVARWADSDGEMDIGARCRVGGRVTSRTRVRLGPNAAVRSVYAPQVVTYARDYSAESAPGVPPESRFTVPPVEQAAVQAEGFDSSRLSRLSSDCWAYKGDLKLSAPFHLAANLVVRGSFSCPAGSRLDADLKASGDVRIGEYSFCKGNLVADGDVILGPKVRFCGLIYAGGSLHLSAGVRGASNGSFQHVAYAAGLVRLEHNVVVRGKVASGERVEVEGGQPG